jgi:hypothetical protein
MKRKNPARGRACGIYAGLGFANSDIKYITHCEVCRIPTLEPLCPTCQSWCDIGHHVQSAARAMESMRPKTTPKKGGQPNEK